MDTVTCIDRRTLLTSDRTVAIGSRFRAPVNVVDEGPVGMKSAAFSAAYSIFVISDSTALHAKLTTCGKHLGIETFVNLLIR